MVIHRYYSFDTLIKVSSSSSTVSLLSYHKTQKMCDPLLVTLLKMRLPLQSNHSGSFSFFKADLACVNAVRWVKERKGRGGGEGGVLRTLSRTWKSRNNTSRWLKLCVYVSRKFPTEKDSAWLELFIIPLSAELMISRVPVTVFCLKPPRKDMSSSLPSFCVYWISFAHFCGGLFFGS